MGGADVVPGVSGGTIAFITGIYEELLDSIKAVDIQALKLLFTFQFSAFWIKINGKFLMPLFLGIATSILSLARLLTYLLKTEPISLWSFFFGLVLISSVVVLRAVKKWRLGIVIALILGAVAAYFITVLSPAETPNNPVFIFISGAIAICAMILPGISGSFLLLIMGKYQYIFDAISNLDIATLGTFGLGCIIGLLSFVRLVSWLLKKYHDIAIGLLSGFMIGSLNKIWPWKMPLAFRVNSHGEQVPYYTKNVLPSEYAQQLGENPEIFQAILFAALGIFIVVVIEKIANYKKLPQ